MIRFSSDIIISTLFCISLLPKYWLMFFTIQFFAGLIANKSLCESQRTEILKYMYTYSFRYQLELLNTCVIIFINTWSSIIFNLLWALTLTKWKTCRIPFYRRKCTVLVQQKYLYFSYNFCNTISIGKFIDYNAN